MVSYGKQEVRVYYQKSTKNKSFIEIYSYLKSQGINNCKFHLQLYDPALASIDPHDPNLSFDMKVRVLKECRHNYWYFIREVVRIPSPGTNTGIMYELNRANLALSFCCSIHLNVFEEIPRQCGKTTSVLTWILWLFNFGTDNSEISFLNKRLQDSTYNLSELKKIRDLLPEYLKMNSTYTTDGKKIKPRSNVESMQHSFNGNIIRTVASARSATAAASLMRGRTVPIIYIDEWAFVPYNGEIYSNMVPAFNTAANYARMNGKPSGIIITTTPGVLTNDEGIYANEMRLAATPFNERIFYDTNYQNIMEIINSNNHSTFVYIKFTYQQLGKSEQWFKELCIRMGLDWPSIRREILLEWAQSNSNCPFSQEDLDIIKSLIRSPITNMVFFNKFSFNIYEQLNNYNLNKYPPLIGVDVSGGYNKDSSAITIVDSYTTKVVADFNCNYISTPELASLLIELVKYLPNAVINVERNGGYGASVLAKLVRSSIKRNLWYTIEDRVLEERFGGVGAVQRRSQKIRVYGSDSSKRKRDELIEILRDRVEYHKDKIVSPILYNELCGMEIKKNGKVEHSINTHDDGIFSWLWALYMYYSSSDLKTNWGIERRILKTDADLEEAVFGVDDNKEDIIQDIDLIEDEQVEEQLSTIQAASAVLYEDWVKSEHAKDEQAMQKILATKLGRMAYQQKYNAVLSEDQTRITTIPEEVFNPAYGLDDEDVYSPYVGNMNNMSKKSLADQFDAFMAGNLTNRF